jgi:hypothetical protein
MDEEEAPSGPPDDAPKTGIYARWMNESDMNKYALKEPEAKLWETVDKAEFDHPFVMEDIKTGGALYSIFHCVRDEMGKYPEDEMVLVHADKDKLWGENFVICTTVEARDWFMSNAPVDTEAAEAAAAAALAEKEAAERAAEDERLANLVYVEVPLVPQPYDSDSLIDTEIAMEQLTGRPMDARPKARVRFTRLRREFGQPLDLHPQDAEILSHAAADFRKHQMAPRMFALRRAELQCGVQVGPGVGIEGGRDTRACQTPWFRHVNKSIQYSSRSISSAARVAELAKPELGAFMERVFPHIDLALSQNETVDVHHTGLRLTPMEAALSLSNPSDTTAKELRFFSHLKYSKEKALVCVDWHPLRSGVIAVSCLPHQTFEGARLVERSLFFAAAASPQQRPSCCLPRRRRIAHCADPPFLSFSTSPPPTLQRPPPYALPTPPSQSASRRSPRQGSRMCLCGTLSSRCSQSRSSNRRSTSSRSNTILSIRLTLRVARRPAKSFCGT